MSKNTLEREIYHIPSNFLTSGRIKFVDFAMNRLFSGLSRATVMQKLEQDYLFVEKVRVDYRNPAAHKNALTAVSAEECIKYVIETQKMLRKMLVDMRF